MSHNPDKNRAICMVAKGSYYGLLLLGWTALVLMVVLLGIGLVLKLQKDWDWQEFFMGLKAVGFLIVLMAVGLGVWWVMAGWFAWAKRYSRDC